MMLPQAFYNGSFLSKKEISVSPMDLGIHRGYSVFDFFKLKDGTNPWFDWYMDRLKTSASAVQIKLPYTSNELKEICAQVLINNQVNEGYIKIILSAGDSVDGYTRMPHASILILGFPLKELNTIHYSKGASLLLYKYTRELAHVKSTNYMVSAMLAPQMKEQNAVDVLYHDGAYISECSRCSFFIVKDGQITTSKRNVLAGITRRRLLAQHSKSGLITINDIEIEALTHADEAFISSTTKGVMPIVQIGEHQIGNGLVGSITDKLMGDINSF